MIDYDLDSGGVCRITWNNPGAPVNVQNAAAIGAFIEAVDRALADPAVKGVIVASAKREFIAGGDLDTLRLVSSPPEARNRVAAINACFRRIETSGKPFVAAVNGSALGGGFELVLACHRRIAADNAGARLGCPEVKLGLIPGTGGTQRLPRLAGVEAGSGLLLKAKTVGVGQAAALGIVDEVVPAQDLISRARDWLLSNPAVRQPWDRPDFRYKDFQPGSEAWRNFFTVEAPRLLAAISTDPVSAILEVLAEGLARNIDEGLAIEARHFGLLACSPAAKNRIRTLFYAEKAARNLRAGAPDAAPFRPRRVGVVGAGQMGAGIALVCARVGLDVILVDNSEENARKGLGRVRKSLDAAVQRGHMAAPARDAALHRITPTADCARLEGCEAVIEAVVEVQGVKEQVIREIAAAAGAEVLMASNTSTLPISVLARASPRPDRFIGLHFFSPVERMALVEVVLGEKTAEATLGASLDLLRIIGKRPVVVRDGPGFFTSRVVAARSREALRMLGEGVSPALIDRSGEQAGMPIGPLAGSDWTSYDLLAEIQGGLVRAGRGTAKDGQEALAAIQRLVEHGRLGRKSGGGVYDYDDRGGRRLWPGLSELFPPAAAQPSAEEIRRRLLHIQSIEAVHAIDDGIIEDPLQADLASVLGWSYPSFHGGVLAYVDEIGVRAFVEQCDELAGRYGERFLPPRRLREMAARGARFHDI
ncbi:MAG: enoyl-CoA hydratase/isomerase family protein [Burkholderiales bacterium]|nr:enoyl-CoA hydratase/isomerase family protein [Burkholderiales bacterium]